ncbi:MAG: TetR/AcrR family transcriptional regulator [Bacteroidales bacterium]|nr:TetR/AcrR family transcriptional regulator [Bacteroidales bacterium]
MDYKQRITEEAAHLFKKYGIRAVTMDMLANNLGISKRTIYEVFRDKHELLSGVVSLMVERQKDLISKISGESENVIEAVYRIMGMMSEHMESMSPAFRLDMMKFRNDIIRNMKETGQFPYPNVNSDLIKRGIEEKVFRDDIDIEITNKCLYEVIRMSGKDDEFDPDDYSKKHVIHDVYINYLRGISTQKGLDLLNFYETQMNEFKGKHGANR